MSPRWADVGGYSLWLYFSEPHQRPHVAVRTGRKRVATLDIATGDVLAGTLPPRDAARLRRYVAAHRAELIEAFERTRRHEQRDTLREREEGPDE